MPTWGVAPGFHWSGLRPFPRALAGRGVRPLRPRGVRPRPGRRLRPRRGSTTIRPRRRPALWPAALRLLPVPIGRVPWQSVVYIDHPLLPPILLINQLQAHQREHWIDLLDVARAGGD